MPFQPGQSGNPSGRPLNTSDRRNQLREMLQSRAPELINKAIEMALDGDPNALRICMDRILPKVRGNHINIDLPNSDLDKPNLLLNAGIETIKALSVGSISIEDAKDFSTILEQQRKLTETLELKTILDALKEIIDEKQLKNK